MAIQDFSKALKTNKDATIKQLQATPDIILNKYGVTGAERAAILEASKKGGIAVEQCLNKLLIGGKGQTGTGNTGTGRPL